MLACSRMGITIRAEQKQSTQAHTKSMLFQVRSKVGDLARLEDGEGRDARSEAVTNDKQPITVELCIPLTVTTPTCSN